MRQQVNMYFNRNKISFSGISLFLNIRRNSKIKSVILLKWLYIIGITIHRQNISPFQDSAPNYLQQYITIVSLQWGQEILMLCIGRLCWSSNGSTYGSLFKFQRIWCQVMLAQSSDDNKKSKKIFEVIKHYANLVCTRYWQRNVHSNWPYCNYSNFRGLYSPVKTSTQLPSQYRVSRLARHPYRMF